MPNPSTEEGQAIRARLVKNLIDRDVLDFLDIQIIWERGRRYTLFDTIRAFSFQVMGVPKAEIVRTVEEKFTERDLSPEKQREVFIHLAWYFRCPSCKKTRTADYFENTQFKLWDKRGEPKLRTSGDCKSCQQQPNANEFELQNEHYTW
ncbi:uncharacterized protein Triagg1_10510 [Trichoderma aggressivum f. europaeum]|uniref:Uncharacterized protein n=1 Tax=Trichoderma aggressivum f. europaeum TaxID=173218 RepID=A0AAE1I5A1_9HYPO|nr:hypothetical protein Triagg1_10510 [Trichoderma aggressivum f. europaeum]